ncbi:MAG: gamma-glutamyltransferase [Acidobacteria bacterium]|nr:gamma-glutamyltransferase [Acidobacteriota bacterium]
MTIARLAASSLILATCALAQRTMFPPVRGSREMVGAANNQEVEAGFRILMQGGNAVDAGVATVLAAAVTEQSRFGLGGEMPLLVKMKGKPVVAISGVGTAPARATVEFYRSRTPDPWEQRGRTAPIPSQGIKAAILPGVFDGLILALKTYGTMSFGQVAAPAIEYAIQGFPIAEENAMFLRNYQSIIEFWPVSKAFFYPTGEPPARGDLVRYQPLGRTLEALVKVEKKKRGNRAKKIEAVRDFFYKGEIARKIADFSQANGGLISYEDLAKFRAEIDQPRSTTFHGFDVHKTSFWAQGPVMLQALNILEGFDLRAMGHNSPEYLHTLVEAVKLAFADRDRYYGDPKFSKIPEEILLSKDYAAERRKLIDAAHASMEHRPGDFAPALPISTSNAHIIVQDTTCVEVVDRAGNVFSATPSGAWLPSVIAGDSGIPLSTRLQSFVLMEGHPNQLQPGKRPRVTLSPTIVTRNGEPYIAMATPGGDFSPGRLNLEDRIPKETADKLAAMGHGVNVTGGWANASAPVVILLRDGVLHGGADPRRARFIFGR